MIRNKVLSSIALAILTSCSLQANSSSEKATSTYGSSLQNIKERLAQASLQEPKGTFVGQLHEKWQFPSDHLPIGVTVGDAHIVSWNVLDADYMCWVTDEKGSQGLQGSMIVDEHVYIEGTNLTVRDRHIVSMILGMIFHPTHPKNIICLQECSKPFLNELSARLPTNFEVVSHHGEALIVDRERFDIVEAKEVSGIFSATPKRALQDVILQDKEQKKRLRLINVHLDGDPSHPARYEFAEYLSSILDQETTTVATGDMNFNELEIADAIQKAFKDSSPFKILSPYCTNISPLVFRSKAIDHFLVYRADPQMFLEENSPEEVMTNLSLVVDLLEPQM